MQRAPLGIFKEASHRSEQQQRHNTPEDLSPLNSPGHAGGVAGVSSPNSILALSTPTSATGDFESLHSGSPYQESPNLDIEFSGPVPYRSQDAQSPVLRRNQSQRSPPASWERGATPLTNNENRPDNSSYRSATVKSSKTEQKKKKRFWNNWGENFGKASASSSSSAAPPQSASSPSPQHSNVTPPQQRVLQKRRPGQLSQQQPSSKPSSPNVGEELDQNQAFAIRSRQRHSVIGLPFQLEPRDDSPSRWHYSSQHQIEPVSPVNTASSQSQAEAGSHKAPAWERLGRTGHQRTASTDEAYTIQSAGTSAQKSRLELNYPEGHYNPNSRPPSRQSIDPPSPSEVTFNPVSHQRTTSSQNSSAKGLMGPANNQQHSTGRNADSTQQVTTTSGSREGQYGSTLSVNNQQSGSYRNTPQASPMVQDTSSSGQGRTTPPPGGNASKSREDLATLDVQSLISRHEELNDKYRKVKKYYFDKDAQVQQLQNTLAHQRLSQSRTSLDDNEYATRFSRLDGAINNLAFNIRKEWKAVPSWLSHCVNKDATTAVTKEMTAVGRACISRWLVDEVFDRYFHPGLEPHLSCQLKNIERNLRRFAPPASTEEERESLLAKISNWRLSTLDGLQDMLNSSDSTEYRSSLTKLLVDMLTQDLKDNLKEPSPPGLDAGVVGIIELAVGVAANLPLESRDVYVDYMMPGTVVNDSYMKVEAALPALTNPGEGPPEGDRASVTSGDDRDDDELSVRDQNPQGKKKGGVLSGLMGGGRKAASKGQESQQVPKEERVRFAAFMSVEVRGKSMLIKAPVYV